MPEPQGLCRSWRDRIVAAALSGTTAAAPAVADHLVRCRACSVYHSALTAPAGELEHLFAPVPPPDRVLRRIVRSTAGRRRSVLPLALGGAAAAVAATALWAGLGAVSRAAVRTDETTLVAAVWASRPPIAAYQAEGIAAAPWPAAPRGAGLVCRLRDGRWLVSVLVHNLPVGQSLREEVSVGGRRLVRTLRPVGGTILDIATLPSAAGPVRWVGLWESGPGGATPLARWRVALGPAAGGPRPVRPSAGWNG